MVFPSFSLLREMLTLPKHDDISHLVRTYLYLRLLHQRRG